MISSARRWKIPRSNYRRLLFRLCLSDIHLLRECPQITPAKKLHRVESLCSTDIVNSEGEKFNMALDDLHEADYEHEIMRAK